MLLVKKTLMTKRYIDESVCTIYVLHQTIISGFSSEWHILHSVMQKKRSQCRFFFLLSSSKFDKNNKEKPHFLDTI